MPKLGKIWFFAIWTKFLLKILHIMDYFHISFIQVGALYVPIIVFENKKFGKN